jgi:hypothetical protein
MSRMEAIAQELLLSGRPPVLDPDEELTFREPTFREPTAIAWQRVGPLGAVLFVVKDTRHGYFRSMHGHYEVAGDGTWFEVSLGGSPWAGELPDRPPYAPGEGLFGVSGISISASDDRVLYLVPGQAVEGVSSIRCDHLDGTVACPVEPRTGAFMAIGVLEPHDRRPRLAAEGNGVRDAAVYSVDDGWS